MLLSNRRRWKVLRPWNVGCDLSFEGPRGDVVAKNGLVPTDAQMFSLLAYCPGGHESDRRFKGNSFSRLLENSDTTFLEHQQPIACKRKSTGRSAGPNPDSRICPAPA